MSKKSGKKQEKTETKGSVIKTLRDWFQPTDRSRDVKTRSNGRVAVYFLIVVVLVVFLPFVNKAFHIDDPLFVWAGKNIESHSSDPYGFKVNWYGADMPMAEVTKNPPLASYYIAFFAAVLGWSEAALHVAFLFPAVGVIVGTYLLARRFCRRPVVAALGALATPVFLVSSTTVMSDTLMLAFWVFALYLWIEGLERNDHLRLASAGVLIALSALTKYFGMTLIPLVLVYSFARKRKPGLWLLQFLIPLAILAVYQWATESLYGRGLLLDAAEYAAGTQTHFGKWSLPKVLIGLAFTGGCLAVVFFYSLQLWSKKIVIGGGLLAVLLAFIISSNTTLGNFPLPGDDAGRWILAIQLGLFAMCGTSLLAFSVLDLYRHRDAFALLLILWIVGTFLFAGFINWTTNGRSILPLVPVAGIVIARRIDEREGLKKQSKWQSVLWPLIAAGILSIAVLSADSSLANSYRSGAEMIHNRHRNLNRPIWFLGHWGFQYYMQQTGARPVDLNRHDLINGDFIAVPTTNTNVYQMNPKSVILRDQFDIPISSWLATMNPYVGAGFYADEWGPLPFAAGSVPPERFYLVEILNAQSLWK